MGKTIDEPTAITWTTAYRDRLAAGLTSNNTAFLIPVADLLGVAAEIMNEGGAPMARAYLAWDATKNEEKLVIVGTSQQAGHTPGSVNYLDMIPTRNAGSNIYDFTEPCPPKCDDTSPLHTGN